MRERGWRVPVRTMGLTKGYSGYIRMYFVLEMLHMMYCTSEVQNTALG